MANQFKPITPFDIIPLDVTDSIRVREFLEQMRASHTLGDLANSELVELSTTILSVLPRDLLRSIHRFRSQGNSNDALLIRNLARDLALERTPPSATSLRGPSAQKLALCLLGMMTLLGEPFTFNDLYGGRLVQDVVPAKGAEQTQTSEGSDAFLDWHVEDAFSEDRCDYLGLLCLRGDPAAVTTFCAARRLNLRREHEQALWQSRFAVVPDTAHEDEDGHQVPVPLLSGSAEDPEIRFDPLYMAPFDKKDEEARAAMRHLGEVISRSAVGHVLEPGDLLIIDNRRVVHGRTAFLPRFDGTDRWLLRVMACASLPKHRRRGGLRAI